MCPNVNSNCYIYTVWSQSSLSARKKQTNFVSLPIQKAPVKILIELREFDQ